MQCVEPEIKCAAQALFVQSWAGATPACLLHPKQDSLLNLLPLKRAKADTSVGFVIRSVKHIKIHAGRKQRGNLQHRYSDCVWSKPLRC